LNRIFSFFFSVALNESGSDYQTAIDNTLKKHKDLQLLFVILPNNKPDLYSVVKKRLAVEVGRK